MQILRPRKSADPVPVAADEAAINGIPTLRSVSPAWAALSDKLAALCAREEELFGRLRPLNEKVARAFGDRINNLPTVIIPGIGPKGPRPGSAALLGDLLPEAAPPPPPPRIESNHPDVIEQRALAGELQDVREAIILLRPALDRARTEGSIKLCQIRIPEYRAIVGQFAKALIALGDATIAHAQFADEMRGAQWGFVKPVQMTSLGNPTDPYSEFRRLLTWAAECGHFDITEIPHNWRTRR